MKFGFMTFSCPQADWEQVLQYAKTYGYEAIEPRIDAKHEHGVELDASADALAQKRAQAEQAGIDISCIATSCRYADPSTAEAQVEHTRKCIDLAAAMGAHRVRVFGGAVPDDISRAAAITHVAEALRRAADHAAEKDVVICMETHDDWCRPAHVAAVMEHADHPSVAVNWDIMHPVTRGGSSMQDAFDTLKPWTRYVHVHDGTWRDGRSHFCSIGEGVVDHTRALQLLQDMNYDGYVSGEWINWSAPEQHLPREIEALRAAAGVGQNA